MHNQASRTIFDYWNNLRHNCPAPLRAEINPASLRHLLPHLFIVADDDRKILSFRLAGTRICELFDREFRGLAFGSAWLDTAVFGAIEIVRDVLVHERPARIDVLASNGDRMGEYEMLLLPIRSTADAPSDRIFGSLLPRESAFPANITPVSGLLIDSWTFLEAGESPPHPSMNEESQYQQPTTRPSPSRLFGA